MKRMKWTSIEEGKKSPSFWRCLQPRFFHVGIKGTAFFSESCLNQHGKNRLAGKRFITGDEIAIEWTPCLEPLKIALHLKIISAGMDYSYSLTSVLSKRPVSIEMQISEIKKISVAIDSFEESLRFITTHDCFCPSLISFDLTPRLASPAKSDLGNIFISQPIKSLQLSL